MFSVALEDVALGWVVLSWQAYLASGVGLAGCSGAQEVLVPDRLHSLALMSGDLWSSAVVGWWVGGRQGY